MLSDLKLAAVPRVLPENAIGVFKDSYMLDFLDLPETHSEADLQAGLLLNLRKFLMELGDGFAFVGEKVRVQVGNQDFELDLLFYHRDLQCLVAFELKTGRFAPEHMGKLAFYLEALDRDRKRPHENPSIGVLLCRTKDDEEEMGNVDPNSEPTPPSSERYDDALSGQIALQLQVSLETISNLSFLAHECAEYPEKARAYLLTLDEQVQKIAGMMRGMVRPPRGQ